MRQEGIRNYWNNPQSARVRAGQGLVRRSGQDLVKTTSLCRGSYPQSDLCSSSSRDLKKSVLRMSERRRWILISWRVISLGSLVAA